MAQKVFNVVPMEEAWTVYQISNELRRANNFMDRSVIEACLSQLADSKLIKRNGAYIAHATFHKATGYKEEIEMLTKRIDPQPATLPKVVKLDPLSKLANLASELRKLSTTIEEVAIEIEQLRVSDKDKLEKLHQLQALLKGL